MPISTVVGNTGGLKTAQIKELERLSRKRSTPEYIISPEMARPLAELSSAIGRQIGLLISRTGTIEMVIVGDRRQIVIPALSAIRSTGGRLKGLRCVHTHLDGEDITEDDLLDLLFLRLDMMAIIKVDAGGLPEKLHAAHLVPAPDTGHSWTFLAPVAPSQQAPTFLETISALEGELTRQRPTRSIDQNRDRAILISVTTQAETRTREEAQEHMDELVELAGSNEIIVLETILQRRSRINAKFLLGRGKLSEIMLTALRLNANLLIFDNELNPSQIRSITNHTELRVIDRTQLILDIFARRALSREGKLQVEMAQLKYMLPRLSTRDDALSRLTGGIGGRGPGETRLEIDRRRINDRLAFLTKKLKEIGRERHRRRSRRRKKDVPVISLVGYTNAGKSTLLNSLTKSTIIAEDKLFATLDPTSRRLRFPQDMEVIITDTVGFIRHLPSELLQAFKATLEELYEADLLVHVIDASNPRFRDQVEVVEGLLHDLELDSLPCLRVLNKTDMVPVESVEHLAREFAAIALSAIDPRTFAPFLEQAGRVIAQDYGARIYRT